VTASDLLIQRLAQVLVRIERDLFDDPDDARLFTDWLKLYRAQQRREESHP
jgi:hypothetical protein